MTSKSGIAPGGAGFGSTGPTRQQAAAFTAAEASHVHQPLQRPLRGGFGVDQDPGNFPVQMYPTDVAMDTDAVIRQQVVAGGQNVFSTSKSTMVPNITYAIGEKDFQFYQAKQEAEELAAFERWLNLQFDFTKPAEVERFARMYPDFFERRLANLRNISNANLRFAEILCTGCQSPDDYLYLYMVQTGRIPLIQGPIWKPDEWFGSTAAELKLAMFNPFKSYIEQTKAPFASTPPPGNFQYPGLPASRLDAYQKYVQSGEIGVAGTGSISAITTGDFALKRTGIPPATNSIVGMMGS